MDRKNKSKLNNKGAAMVLTIIIMAILIVFVFSLILVSYNLYASQNKNLSSARNAEAVNSLSLAINNELTDEDASSNSGIWKFLRTNVAYTPDPNDAVGVNDWEDWPYYDANDTTGKHNEEKAFKYFEMDNNPHIDGMPADVKVCMYWTLPIKSDGSEETAQNLFNTLNNGGSPKGVRLHVRIIATTASQVYETEDVYKLSVKKNNTTGDMVNLKNVFKNYDVADHYPDDADVSNPSDDMKEKWIWKYVGKQ